MLSIFIATQDSITTSIATGFRCFFFFGRLVNGVIEKTRKKEEVSIAVAANAIGMPRTLIDIRHGKGIQPPFSPSFLFMSLSFKQTQLTQCYNTMNFLDYLSTSF